MKDNRKPLIALLVFVLVFASFIWVFTSKSDEQIAIMEINKSTDLVQIKKVWDNYEHIQKKGKFSKAIRKQISSLNLKEDDLIGVMSWLPPLTDNLNIIIIPDLSKRTADGTLKHNQMSYDTALLSQVWKSFESQTRNKINSKNRLIIDVADDCQAQGKFRNFADNLIFDLSNSKEANTSLYFKKNSNRFYSNIENLYITASKSYPAANNYIPYFNNRLKYHLRNSNLEDRYRNIIFILTDGYMEEDGNCNSNASNVKIWTNNTSLNNFALKRNETGFQYPSMREKFPDLEIYVFEIDPRNSHELGLIHWWETWATSMDIKNKGFVFPHTPSKIQWQSKIKEIINS